MTTRPYCITTAVLLLLGVQEPGHAQSADVQTDTTSDVTVHSDPTKEFVKKVNDATGLEFWGYGRGGGYRAHNGMQKGGYSLGGDLQKYRLGNEGDNYLEFGMGKRFDMGNGVQWGAFYMPAVYNSESSTKQLYFSLEGIFGNAATLWVGQRYHRIQDVHIVDHWILEDGHNYGVGVDNIPIGSWGKLNVAAHTADSIDNQQGNPNNAKRLNVQWRDIPANNDGKFTMTGALISGDFAKGKNGGALGFMHTQKNFLATGIDNIVLLQASTGHASISGKFYHLDNRIGDANLLWPLSGETNHPTGLSGPVRTRSVFAPQPGATQRRILDSVNFQIGRFGGQTLIGYQTTRSDESPETKDLSLGGRLSYGMTNHTKLLAELAATRRSVGDLPRQSLYKSTVAAAFSPSTDFWSRPELRIYATRANWNKAAADANSSSFGANGRRGATTFGIQLEAWWG